MSTTERKATKKRVRRNYEKELSNLKAYCQIKVEVLESIDKSHNDPLWQSSIEAYRDVLARMNGGQP